MKRLLSALAILLLAALPAPAADTNGVTIRWHGQSFFEVISSKGTRIVIDPHAIPSYGRISVSADLILISHLHNDHTQVGVVENYNKAKRIDGVVGSLRNGRWNLINEEPFKDVKVSVVGGYHDDEQGLKRGLTGILIIEVDGLRIVHLGDLGHIPNAALAKKIGRPDVLMIPVGGVYTINGSEAKKVVEVLKPTKYILPMHYGTDVYDDLLPITEFLEGQKPENVKKPAKSPRNELIVTPDFRPAEPVIEVLYWQK